jgi:hypothetical protein
LGASDAELATEWFSGWFAAACDQQPELAADAAAAYRQRRLAQARSGRLELTVDHADLLIVPH